jgi:hypothetical protein
MGVVTVKAIVVAALANFPAKNLMGAMMKKY